MDILKFLMEMFRRLKKKNTYSVCAGQKKCAGFGLSATLTSYFAFAQQCLQKPGNLNPTSLQNELNGIRGAGYGGADWNIKYWDANQAHTYALLNQAKQRMDPVFLANIRANKYDYCGCQTFENFHNWMLREVIPTISRPNFQYTDNTWVGTSQTVQIARNYYNMWLPLNTQMNSQIAGLRNWCLTQCARGRNVAEIQEIEELDEYDE